MVEFFNRVLDLVKDKYKEYKIKKDVENSLEYLNRVCEDEGEKGIKKLIDENYNKITDTNVNDILNSFPNRIIMVKKIRFKYKYLTVLIYKDKAPEIAAMTIKQLDNIESLSYIYKKGLKIDEVVLDSCQG